MVEQKVRERDSGMEFIGRHHGVLWVLGIFGGLGVIGIFRGGKSGCQISGFRF